MKEKFKITTNFLLIILIGLMLQGCFVGIFSSKYRKIDITCQEGATIFYDNKDCGKSKATLKWKKNNYVEQVVVKKEGYLDKTHSVAVRKKNPLLFADLIWAPTFYGIYIFFFDGYLPKSNLYPKRAIVPQLTKAPESRKDGEKYMYLNKISLNLSSSDTAHIYFPNPKDYEKNKNKSINQYEKDLEVENLVFSEALEIILKKYNFIDTTKTIFPNFSNTIYFKANVEDLKITSFASKGGSSKPRILKAETTVVWEILDYYETKIVSFKIATTSDLFRDDFKKISESENDSIKPAIKVAIQNAIELSMIELLDKKEVKELIKINSIDIQKEDTIKLVKPIIESTSLNKLINSAVTIKTKDGHGSGFIISNDGYIVTNYHVVANNTDKLEAILADGTKHVAKLVRKSVECDLALLKIEKTDLVPFQINEEKAEIEIGSNVSTIGTPKSIELGQTVSKGTISGIRKANGSSYIQTDMNINSGNSGGALLNDKGQVVGIITSKLFGFGVEGIGFAIPSVLIFEKLRIKY